MTNCLLDFNGMSTPLELFYALEIMESHSRYIYIHIFSFVSWEIFLKIYTIQSFTINFETDVFNPQIRL